MGNVESTQKLAIGFAKEIENTTAVESSWKVSDSRLIMFLIVAYVHKDIKDLQLKQVLNVAKEVDNLSDNQNGGHFLKSSVDMDLPLLAMEAEKWFGVINIQTKREIWSLKRETHMTGSGGDTFGYQTHHWLTLEQQKYLSVQTERAKITMFKVIHGDDDEYQFVADEKYEVVHTKTGSESAAAPTINFCEIDRDFKHIFLIVDNSVLQKRALNNVKTVLHSVELDEKTNGSVFRNFRLSADGRFCVLGGGYNHSYFYVIDIVNKQQQKLTSTTLDSAYVPCFVNGDSQFVAVADKKGRIEIWDVRKQEVVKLLQTAAKDWIKASTSRHNILAIGSDDKVLRLYDVRNWECVYQQQFDCQGWSLHLMDDLKYVTVAGSGGERCVVLEIV